MKQKHTYPANLFLDLINVESNDERLADYLISHLRYLEAVIVRARYQEYRTYRSIAEELDSNSTSVSIRCHRALKVMKAPLHPGIPLIYEIVAQDLLERKQTAMIRITENTAFYLISDISEIADRTLPRNGVETLGQIADLSEEDILSLHGVGPKTAKEIIRFQSTISTWLLKGEYLLDTRRYALYKESLTNSN